MKRYLAVGVVVAVAALAIVATGNKPSSEQETQAFIVTSEVPSAEGVANVEPAAGNEPASSANNMLVTPPALEDAMDKMVSDAPAPNTIVPSSQ